MNEHKVPCTIHLVDDDSISLLYLFDHLSAAGFRVAASSSALDALEAISRGKPEIVVCNAEMPDLGGLDLLDRILSLSPRTMVLLMGSDETLQEREDARRRGALDYLLKPCRAQTVIQAVERILEGVH